MKTEERNLESNTFTQNVVIIHQSERFGDNTRNAQYQVSHTYNIAHMVICHISDLELELLPVSKETLDILMLATWHAGSVLKVLTKLKNIYSFAGDEV